MTLLEKIHEAKVSGNLDAVAQMVPFHSILGFELSFEEDKLMGKMPFSDHLIGNLALPALHGGTTGALLESTAGAQVALELETAVLPKIINITINYLRSGKPLDTFASGTICRKGRRVVNVHVEAWQESRKNLIASATAHFLVSG